MIVVLFLLSQYEDLSLSQLLEIQVVTAMKKPLELKEVPVPISVITQDMMEGYRSVPDVLEDEAGIYVNRDLLFDDVGLRGIVSGMRGYSRGWKILINGMPVSYRVSSIKSLGEEFIPLDAVERIEIVKGPSSALYGANAFLGVINIITKKHTAFRMSGSVKGWEENAVLWKEGFLFVERGGYWDRSGLSVPSESPASEIFSGESDNDIKSPLFLYYRFEKERFFFDHLYQRTKTYGEFTDWGKLTHENIVSYENSHMRIGVDREWKMLRFTTYLIYSYGSPTDEEHLYTGKDYYVVKNVAYQGMDFSEEVKLTGEKGEFLAGYDISLDRHSLPNVYHVDSLGNWEIERRYPPVLQGDSLFINHGVYAQGLLKATDKFIIGGGVREDIQNIYGNFFSYRAGISFTPGNFYIKLFTGTSFKAPPPDLLFGRPIREYGGVLPNPSLRPEKASEVEITAGGAFGSLSSFFSLYYLTVKDKIELVPSGGAYRPRNIASLSGYGVEFGIKGRFSFARPYINVSWTRMEDDEGNITEVYPEFMVKGGFQFEFSPLKGYIRGRYAGERRASLTNRREYGDYALSPYLVLDAGIGFDMGKCCIEIDVKNLLDEEYTYAGYGGIDVPSLPREFYASLIFKP